MLYAIGCSFTYGDELQDRTKSAWPYILGNMLNMDVVNLAICGSSNDYIVRPIITKVLSKTITERDLVIVGWTGIFRKEFYSTYLKKYIELNMASLDIKNRIRYIDESSLTFCYDKYLDDIYGDAMIFYETFYNNSFVALNDKSQSMLLLDSFLIHHKIPHVFFNAIGNLNKKVKDVNLQFKIQNEEDPLIVESYNLRYSELQKRSNIILSQSMELFCLKYPIGKRLHPLEEGHKKWAEFLYEQIITSFAEFNVSV